MSQFVIALLRTLRVITPCLFGLEDGQDMLEYGLLAALVSFLAIAIIILFGSNLQNLFQDVVNGLGTA